MHPDQEVIFYPSSHVASLDCPCCVKQRRLDRDATHDESNSRERIQDWVFDVGGPKSVLGVVQIVGRGGREFVQIRSGGELVVLAVRREGPVARSGGGM